MHDGQSRTRCGQAPPVPPGDDLVQVVPVGGVARCPVEGRELEEPHVRSVVEDRHAAGLPGRRHPAPVQAVPLLGDVVPDLDPDAAHQVVEQQLAGPVVGRQRLGLLHPCPQLVGPVAAGQREAGRAQRAGRRRGRVAVGLAGVLPRQVASVLVELEAGGVRVGVEHHPLVLAERQGTAHPGAGRPGREHRPVHHDGRPPRRKHLQVGGRGRHRHAHPGGAGERGPRPGGVQPVQDDVDREPEPAQERGRGPERRDLGVEVVLGPLQARGRRRVGVGLGAGLLLRLLGSLVVAPHRVRVDDQLERGVRGQVLPHQAVQLAGHPQVGLRVVQQHLHRRGPVDDVGLVRRQRRDLAAVPALGVGLVELGERADRRQRVAQPLRRDLQRPACPAGGVLDQPAQRTALVQVGERLQQPARHRVRGQAGPVRRRRGDGREVQVHGMVAHPAGGVGAPGLVGERGCGEAVDRRTRGQDRGPGGGVGGGDDAQRQRGSRVQRRGQGQRAAGQRVDPVGRGGEVRQRRASDQLVGHEDGQLERCVVGQRVRQRGGQQRGGHRLGFLPLRPAAARTRRSRAPSRRSCRRHRAA